MRRSPEKLIARLRNRRVRIIGSSVVSVLALGALAYGCFLLGRLNSILIPQEGDDLLLHVLVSQSMVSTIVTITAISLLLAACTGLALGSAVSDAFFFTKNDLLVCLWDRVQALEQSQPTSRTPRPPMPDPQSPIPNP